VPASEVSSLVMVANARLPTEKAHGHAIVKLCEAFTELGASVELWHPRRHQARPDLACQTVFQYYGVNPSYVVRRLPNLDVVRLERVLPGPVLRNMFRGYEALWGLYVARLATRRPADLYVTRDVMVAWALARSGLSTIIDVHAVPNSQFKRRALCRLAALPAVRAFIALTEENRRLLIQSGISADRIFVAPSAVDVRQYENLPSRDECRSRHGLPADRLIVGYIGRFEAIGEEKGIDFLIRSFAVMKRRMQAPALLVCVGGPMHRVPEYLGVARAVGLKPDDVRFVDHVPARKVPTLISGLDVATAPSPPTAFLAHLTSPLKLQEYAAAGVPIVTTDLPANHEALKGVKDVAFVTYGDVESMARALEVVLSQRGKGRFQQSLENFPRTYLSRARVFLNAAAKEPSQGGRHES
jgi:glycosyltransferase involved in cell wall biosynthesis